MRRYYSHYTYIYPDICLKNHIVEVDDEAEKIIRYFPFEKEIENTEFYSGLLIFLPLDVSINNHLDSIKNILDDYSHLQFEDFVNSSFLISLKNEKLSIYNYSML